MIIFDDVEIPWENVFFYQHTHAAAYIRATLHRYFDVPVRPAAPALRGSASRDRAIRTRSRRASRCTGRP